MMQARVITDDTLATALHDIHTTVAITPVSAPGSLAFAQGMFLNVSLIADWQAIAHLGTHHVNENLQ